MRASRQRPLGCGSLTGASPVQLSPRGPGSKAKCMGWAPWWYQELSVLFIRQSGTLHFGFIFPRNKSPQASQHPGPQAGLRLHWGGGGHCLEAAVHFLNYRTQLEPQAKGDGETLAAPNRTLEPASFPLQSLAREGRDHTGSPELWGGEWGVPGMGCPWNGDRHWCHSLPKPVG